MKSPFTKRGQPTLGELLPYVSYDESKNLIWLQDGSASSVLRITPKNALSSTDDELESLRTALSDALNQLPEGGTLQIFFIREKTTKETDLAAGNWFANHPIGSDRPHSKERASLLKAKSEQLEAQWESGEIYQSRIYLTVRIAPEQASSYGHRTGPLAYVAASRSKATRKIPQSIEDELTAISNSMRIGLESHGFEIGEPKPEELLKIVYKFLNPDRSESVGLPVIQSARTLSDQLALTDLIETREGFYLGRTQIRIGSLKSYPDSSTPALMNLFAGEPETFFLVYTVLSLSQSKEKDRLGRKQRLATGMAGGNHVRDLQAESQLRDVEDTLSAMITSGEKIFASSLQIVTFGDDSEESKIRFYRLLETGERLGGGCQWFEETVGAYPVFFGILPFAPTYITRPKRLLTGSITDFLPVYGTGPGHSEASVLLESQFQSLVGFSLFEDSPSGNAIVLGETGSGKSVFVAGMLLGTNAGFSERAPAAFVIDVGNSFKRTVLYLGGTSIDFSPDGGATINPFDLETGQTLPDPEKVKFLTAFFDEILGERGSLSKLERALLETEILFFYERPGERTISRFKEHLSKNESIELRQLAKLLSLWCRPRPYGLLFDGKTNVDLTSPHIHLEIKGCQRYPDLLRVAMLTAMELGRRKVRENYPRKTYKVIDECQTVIRSAGDGLPNSAARYTEDDFRQARKFGSAVIGISQTARDFITPEIGEGIIANAPNRFILNQAGDEKTLRDVLKLNEQELRDVFSLTQARGMYSEVFVQSKSMKGVVRYRPTALELWLCTTHPPDTVLLNEEEKANPDLTLHELMDYMAAKYPNGSPDKKAGVV